MQSLTVALWAANLARPLNGIGAWAALVDQQMAEAKAQGARILVMPEYVSAHWLAFAPEGLPKTGEIAWMAEQGEAALAAIRPLVGKHDMALLAGSMPVKAERPGEYLNRAWLLLPDGRTYFHDKLVLTPGEKDPDGWSLSTGDRFTVVEWEELRLGMLICLDVEMPALAAKLAPADLDLLIVPSMTSFRSGYHRVFDCAKARAVELQAIVCAVGAIGVPGPLAGRDTNCSGAAVFLPCERALGETGTAASIGPWNETEGAGPMLVARDLPVAAVRRSRRGAAEVWPGGWDASHVTISDG
jgi:predicted amidohydrolase